MSKMNLLETIEKLKQYNETQNMPVDNSRMKLEEKPLVNKKLSIDTVNGISLPGKLESSINNKNNKLSSV